MNESYSKRSHTASMGRHQFGMRAQNTNRSRLSDHSLNNGKLSQSFRRDQQEFRDQAENRKHMEKLAEMKESNNKMKSDMVQER